MMRSLTKIFLLGVCLVTSSGSMALTCDSAHGGEIITAQNGTQFCKSIQLMNWLSAHTWCTAIGGKLAEYDSICPEVSNNICSNMNIYASGNNVWVYANKTQDASNFSNVSITNLKGGATEFTLSNRPVTPLPEDAGGDPVVDIYALCE